VASRLDVIESPMGNWKDTPCLFFIRILIKLKIWILLSILWDKLTSTIVGKSLAFFIDMRMVSLVPQRLTAVRSETQAGLQPAQAKSTFKSVELQSNLRIATISSGTSTKNGQNRRHLKYARKHNIYGPG
jgi:hypothetical protein